MSRRGWGRGEPQIEGAHGREGWGRAPMYFQLIALGFPWPAGLQAKLSLCFLTNYLRKELFGVKLTHERNRNDDEQGTDHNSQRHS